MGHNVQKEMLLRLRSTLGVLFMPSFCIAMFFAMHSIAGSQSRKEPPQTLFTRVHPAMGTEFTLYIYSASSSDADTVSEEVFDEVDRVEQLLSNYRPSSELSRINQNAAAGPVTTDPEMLSFLRQSEHWSKVSDGGFDITVGRLMKSWGFYRHSGRIPPDEELERLRSVTGWEKVVRDDHERTVRFTAPGIELDPGGIGKGFAVDAAVLLLKRQHVRAALISAGNSTIYALGAPPGKAGWRIAVPGPLPLQEELSWVSLRDMSLSSADCSQKNFTIDGHLYCHIMDPRTMRPVEGRIQVTILDPSATASDALSNVLFVGKTAGSARLLAKYAPRARVLLVTEEKGSASVLRCLTYQWRWPVSAAHCSRSTF